MTRVEVRLDEGILEQARRLAAARRCTLDEVIRVALAGLPGPNGSEDRLLGLFADEPELADAVAEDAMPARERDPLRRSPG